VNVSKSRVQVGGVRLQSRKGELRYELAQRWELASLFDGTITGDRTCSFCIESIAVRMNVARLSNPCLFGEMRTKKTWFEIRRPFRIPTPSSHS
jgi:hypothetical protein